MTGGAAGKLPLSLLPGKAQDSGELSETTGFGQNVRHQSFKLRELWL
jgi:hypothetical protein